MFEVSTTSFDTNVDERRLVAERAKFAKHVMVSAGVCFGGKGKLHFIPDKTKVNAKLYVETLLPELVQDCRSVCHLASSFNRTARLHTRQSWLKTGTAVKSMVKMNGFRTRLTSTRLTTMYEELSLCLNATSHSNPTSMSSRKFCSWYGTSCCQGLDQESHIELPEKTSGFVTAGGGYFEHMLKWTTCQILVFVITVKVSWQWKLQVAVAYSVQNWNCGIEYLYSCNFGEN